MVCVYQFLDLTHSAWHAGRINTQSVGIDICQQADARWLDYYKDAGVYDVELIENPSSRGPAEVVSLDPELHWAVKDFVGQLMQILHDQLDSFDASLPFPDADELIKDFNEHSVLDTTICERPSGILLAGGTASSDMTMKHKHIIRFMRQCLALATNSPCPRAKFGAIIADPDSN